MNLIEHMEAAADPARRLIALRTGTPFPLSLVLTSSQSRAIYAPLRWSGTPQWLIGETAQWNRTSLPI